jgi:hypothetical protein
MLQLEVGKELRSAGRESFGVGIDVTWHKIAYW